MMVPGCRGLPPGDPARFVYRVDFVALDGPTAAEAIVMLWFDEPEIDEDRLRARAVEAMREMVARGA